MPTKIDYDKCTKCGTCIEVCPEEVYEENEDGSPKIVAAENCTECGICVEECPEEAIELV
ncbi:MAG: 4Fe-4S binding protein [Candidatus Heimdallarchaeota archaeon]|nr:MAG: 4Fe-4S ferredoxin [Candidatus Gerdarchaeota archaeon]RLI70214.1 MAG: 4Fe-4S ferredoxin [Candidatus Gerdarchaeota archaeon]